MKITKTSFAGLNIIKEYEGLRTKPYLCPAGIPTIGYGATFYEDGKKVTLKDKEITPLRAEELLRFHLEVFEKYVDTYTTDAVNQSQFDALVSFTFNLGPNNLKNSTLLKKVNANPNDPNITKEFLRWNIAGGKVSLGLTRRRTAEAKLYFNGQ